MSSLYQATVPHWIQFLENTLAFTEKAETWAKENGKDEKELVNSRLSPDMLGVGTQVNILEKVAHEWGTEVCGMEPYEWNVKLEYASLAEVRADIHGILKYLKTIPAHSTDGKEAKEVTARTGVGSFRYSASFATFEYYVPNFYFHVTTIYANYRALGVPLGKQDFLGPSMSAKYKVA